MAPSLARTWTGLAIVLATLDGAPARAQEPAPVAPQEQTSPEELLRSKGLKRSGSTWVLSDDETTVLKDRRDAREIFSRYQQATIRRQSLELDLQDRQGAMMHLRAQNDTLSQQIAQLDQQLEQLVIPPGGNNFVALQREQVANARNDLVRRNNQIVNLLNNFQEQNRQNQEQDPRLQLNAEVAEARERYMQALVEFRNSADKLTEQYKQLARDQDVTRALEAMSVTLKARQKLGPSKAVQDAIKLLERAEGTVKSESISLTKENGVDHVYATLNRTPVKMVFDTGAGLTTISSTLASKVGARPKATGSAIKLKTADGTVVDGKIGTIPTVRVGKFTIKNVECAIMPAEKGEIDPLLGQSFLKNFKVEYQPDAGKLVLKQVETAVASPAAAAEDDVTKPAPKAVTKSRRPGRQPRPAVKSRQTLRGRPDAATAEPTPADAPGEPN